MAIRRLAVDACIRWGVSSCTPSSLAVPSVFLSRRGFATEAETTVRSDRKYAKSHEWVKAEGDVATVGVSKFAVTQQGDIIYVEVPEVGTKLNKADAFGVVESVKAASDVYSPVSGTVTEVNDALADEPSKLNDSPYDDGWLIRLKMSNQDDLKELLDASAYQAQIEES